MRSTYSISLFLILVLVLALGFAASVSAQEWVHQFGSNGGASDSVWQIAADGIGNVYVVGDTGGVLPGESTLGSIDAYIRKYDANGNLLWTRQFGTGTTDSAVAVAVDASGIYVGGYTSGTLPDQTRAGSTDAFVRKYDVNGNVIWTRQFGSEGTGTVAYAIALSGSAVYVAGHTSGTLPGQTSAGNVDAFLRKYDTSGTELWTRQFGSSGDDYLKGAAADGSSIYVTGYTRGTLPGQTSAGSTDAFVMKFDDAGNTLWTRQFGTSGFDQGNAIAVYGGGIYVAGITDGALPGQTTAGSRDVFLRKYDAGGTVVWTRQFGTTYQDEATAIAANAAGIYVTGYTGGAFTGYTNAGQYDIFVRLYDGNGNVGWTRQSGSSSSDYPKAATADSSGVYVAGDTDGALPGQVSAGDTDAFLRKYDAAGSELWTRQFGSNGSADLAQGVAVDVDGSIYVAGITLGTLPAQTSAGSTDAFLLKCNASGKIIWTRQFGSTYEDRANAVAVHASGIYVAGYSGGTLPGQTSAGSGDAFLRKYDTNGTEIWTRQFGTTSVDEAQAVGVDSSGIYVTGRTLGSFPTQTSAGNYDVFVRKYDHSGTELWTRQFGSTGEDGATGIAVDASGIYVAGYTGGTLPGQASSGGTDSFLRKYDANGTAVWTRQFGSSGGDYAFGVAAGSAGIYVAGSVYGTLPGQTSAGSYDAYLRKYDAAGNELWTRQFGSPDTDYLYAVAVDGTGVYMAGWTSGSLPGLTSSGDTDAWLRKYDHAGSTVWTQQFGTESSDFGTGVAVDGTGVYLVGYTDGVFSDQIGAGGLDAFVMKFNTAGPSTPVTVTTNPAGRSFAVDAITYIAPQTFSWIPGDTHTIGLRSPQTFTGTRYVFANWSDGGAQSHSITVTSAPTTYTVNFTTQYLLTALVSPTGAGAVTINPISFDGYYNSGVSVQLTGNANTGFLFNNWTGDLTGSVNPQSVIMSAPRSVTAVFTPVGGPPGLQFVAVTPCRVADTRNSTGSLGGPMLSAGVVRTFPLPQGTCGIPATAKAYSLNVTVVPPGFLGYLTVWPTGLPQPGASTLNALDGQVTANAAIVPAGTAGAVDVYAMNATHVILDINGYFDTPQTGSLAFYPLAPCRVIDTRGATSTFGGPPLAAGVERSFPILVSACGVPTAARAYAFNVTVVPPGFLGYITAWPTGQTMPVVSTTNALDGQVTANAAIIPAGASGAVSFYAMNNTNLVVDINGYFAPPGSAGALNFYTAAPCRVADTRGATGPFGGPMIDAGQARSFAMPACACGLPAWAQAFSLNFTVVPPGSMGYLTAWPTGQTMPVVSTLNALDGQVTANAGIIPAGTSGAISVYVMNQAHVVIDANGYFAP